MVSYEQLTNDNLQDAALIDNKSMLGLLLGSNTVANGIRTAINFAPYANDIWQGKELLLHKPFDKMSRKEFKNYGKLGKQYYQNFLQKNPINIKDYGEISFGATNRGKDKTVNMAQYPFLRKNLATSQRGLTTNNKNEADRVYDHFSNTHQNNLYDYIIENITKDGKRYKMMKNKTLGE